MTIDEVINKAKSTLNLRTDDEVLSWLNRPQYGSQTPKLSALRMMLSLEQRLLLWKMLDHFDDGPKSPLEPLLA